MSGLMVYIRRGADTVPVELPSDATVGDLKCEAAKIFKEVTTNGLRLGDTVLKDDALGLADAGFSAQVTVDVEMAALRWDEELSSKSSIIANEGMVCSWSLAVSGENRDDYCGQVIVGTHGWTSGRHYWEVVLEAWDGSGSGRDVIGVCTESLFQTEQGTTMKDDAVCGMGSSPHCWGIGMWQSPFRKEHHNEEGNFKNARSPKQGDRIGVLLDLDVGFIRFYLDGRFISTDEEDSAFISIPSGETYRPAVSVGRLSTKHKYRIIADPPPPEDKPWIGE